MKKLIAVGAAVALLLVSAVPALADDCGTQTVTVTATPSYICIANAPGSFDFAVVAASSTENTSLVPFTITNSSTIPIDINIGCTSWTSSGTPWTYGAAGADTAELKAGGTEGGPGGSTGSGYDLTILTSGVVLLSDALPISTNVIWNMQLDAPTTITHGDPQSTTVTLTAAAN